MTPFVRAFAIVLSATVLGTLLADHANAQQPQVRRPAGPAPVSFREDVMPIFKGYCLECHQPGGAGYEKSGVDLRSYDGVMKGTKFGAMIIPKEPEFSSLMRLVDGRTGADIRMPHNAKRLPEGLRTLLRRWIMEGAQNN